jgi:activator of 2-hydroxyglutaryl-CoA dehydratase
MKQPQSEGKIVVGIDIGSQMTRVVIAEESVNILS